MITKLLIGYFIPLAITLFIAIKCAEQARKISRRDEYNTSKETVYMHDCIMASTICYIGAFIPFLNIAIALSFSIIELYTFVKSQVEKYVYEK